MANVETMGLGPQKSMFVLVIIVGCFAVLWPRILSPMFVGPAKDGLSPNSYDKEAGCCDVISDTDVNAIKIMAEVCNNILRSQSGKIDSKMEQALASGKLTAEIISTCRDEVNKTCGVDIALFLDHNIRLGKTYRQILDDVRSYNSSNCLKMNYGVAPWSLGVPHLVGKYSIKTMSVRQERPPHLQHPPLHPALRERGRAIVNPVNVPRAPRASSQGPPLPGRPMPVRPPMGGAGGVVPPPKSSVGFLMPLYTLCIVVFFFYTVFKMVFSKGTADVSPVHQPRYIERPDSKFTQSVFKNTSRRDRNSPETKLGDEEMDQLRRRLAETERAMERIVLQLHRPQAGQEVPPPYTNGSVHHNKEEESPLLSKGQERLLREPTPPSWEDSTPVDREESLLAKEFTILKEEPTPTKESDKENVPPQEQESKPEEYEKEVALKEAALLKEVPSKETSLERDLLAAAADLEYEPEYPEKIGEVVEEKLIEEAAIRQLRSSVEKENASFKVLGMEMRAHCEGGAPWSKRSTTPPAGRITPPPSMHSHTRQPTPPVEVSSIYLEGALPHQSRLLVADSQTHTEKLTNGDDKDPPIVLSGKMTLSLINDESAKTTPERDNAVMDDLPFVENDLPYDDDEEFLTASAATSPKQDEAEYEDGSEEEIDEDQIDEDMEVRNMLEDQPAQNDFLQGERVQRSTNLQGEETIQDVVAPVDEHHEPTKIEDVLPKNLENLVAAVEEEEHVPTNIEEDVVVPVDDHYEATKIEEVLATDVDDFEAAFDKLAATMEEDIETDVFEYQTLTVEEDKPTFLQGESVSSISLQGAEAIQDVVVPVDEHHEATKIEEVLSANVDDFVAAVDKLAAALEEEKQVATNIEEDVVADVDEYETTAFEKDKPTHDDFLQGERVSPISLQGEETIQDVVALVDEQLEATKNEEVLTTNVDKLVSAAEVEKHVATNNEEDVVAEVDEYETITVEEDQPAQNDFLQGERVSSISLQGEETIQDVVTPIDEHLEATKIEEVLATNVNDFVAAVDKLAAAMEEEKHVATNIEEVVVADVDEYETITVEEDQPAQNDFLQDERVQLNAFSLQGEETIQDVAALVDEQLEAIKVEEVLNTNVDELVAAVEVEKHVTTNIEEEVAAEVDEYETTTVEEDQPAQNDFLQGERVSSISLQGEENIQDVLAPIDEHHEATKIEEVLAKIFDDSIAAVEKLTAAKKEEEHVGMNVEEDVVADVDEYQTVTVEEDVPQYIEYIVATSVSQDLTGNAINAADSYSANVAAIASEKIEGEDTTYVEDDIVTKVIEAPYVEVLESTNLEDLVSAIINDEFALDGDNEVLTNVSNDEVANIEYDEELEPAFVEDLEETGVEYEVVVSAADDVTSNAEICEMSSVYDVITSLEDASTDGAGDNVTSNIEDYKSTILEDEVAPNVVDDETTNVEGKKLKNVEIQDVSDLETDLLKNLEEDVPSNVVEERESAKVEIVNIVEENTSDEEEEYEEEIIEEEVEEEEEIEEVEEEEEIEEIEEEEEEIEEEPAVNKGTTAVKKA